MRPTVAAGVFGARGCYAAGLGPPRQAPEAARVRGLFEHADSELKVIVKKMEAQATWANIPRPSLDVLEWQSSRAQVVGVEQELQATQNELFS